MIQMSAQRPALSRGVLTIFDADGSSACWAVVLLSRKRKHDRFAIDGKDSIREDFLMHPPSPAAARENPRVSNQGPCQDLVPSALRSILPGRVDGLSFAKHPCHRGRSIASLIEPKQVDRRLQPSWTGQRPDEVSLRRVAGRSCPVRID